MAVLLITHDLGVVAKMADDVVVMYRGEVVERGTSKTIFREPRHPYLKALMRCRAAASTCSRSERLTRSAAARPADASRRPRPRNLAPKRGTILEVRRPVARRFFMRGGLFRPANAVAAR